MNRKYPYFDKDKSLVENVYYLLMIFSIGFVVIQVVIAGNSLEHSAQLELTQHTVEQNNRYRVVMTEKCDELTLGLKDGKYPVPLERITSVLTQQGNLEEMTIEQLRDLSLFNDSIVNDPTEYWKFIQIQNDLANELDQYAFFVLNGFMFEELSYENMGNAFLSAANICAIPAIYMVSYHYYNLYHTTVNQSVRQLYDIWWHREQIDKRRNRIAICNSILAGDEREMGFLRQGELAELSLSHDELQATIRQMKTELASLEKTLAVKLKRTSVRNM